MRHGDKTAPGIDCGNILHKCEENFLYILHWFILKNHISEKMNEGMFFFQSKHILFKFIFAINPTWFGGPWHRGYPGLPFDTGEDLVCLLYFTGQIICCIFEVYNYTF